MQTKKNLVWLLLATIIFTLPHCKPKPTDVFEGKVVNYKNEGLQEAEVEINGTKTKTANNKRMIDPPWINRYHLEFYGQRDSLP